MSGSTSGWYPDPSGRHQQRWYDGTAWTGHVADGGARGDDPLPPPTAPAGAPGAPAGAPGGPRDAAGACATCGGADLMPVHLSADGHTVLVYPDVQPGFRGAVKSIGTLRGRACLTCGAVSFSISPP
jgi:hypothetical protein